MPRKILVLPGDYIGPEIIAEAVKVLEVVNERHALGLELEYGLLGGAAIDEHGVPLPDQTLAQARAADAILLDAPCSASGIIRRHPDIRLLRKPEDIEQLARQQQRLLRELWPLLKPGGRMLYATCSIFRRENELQVKDFLQATPDCVEVPLSGHEWGLARPHGRQILPGIDDMDGFFYACLSKQA